MKTIEEKAKAYDEARERFKSFKEKYYTKDTNLGDVIFDKTGEMQKDFEQIFPDLAGSEDERIRKILIETMACVHPSVFSRYGINVEQVIDYLEKQKEQKPNSLTKYVYSKEDKRFIQDCANILIANDYAISAERLLSMFEQKPVEWSEEDEKIITNACEQLNCYAKSYHNAGNDTRAKEVYEVAEKLKSIHPVRQKWSEEDEKMLEQVVDIIYDYCPDSVAKYKLKDWLMQLRPQPHWKPSDEQLKELNFARLGRTPNVVHEHLDSLYNDLLKLKQQ